ncbi:MAG TPA: DUF6112 family protein [Acidimicrobiales bacterium]|nr:DUF6112 family protein [Acidimicrobiales bacterium]
MASVLLSLAALNPLVFAGGGVVNVTPDAGGVPGSSQITQIADGIGWWALLISVMGLIVGAAAWAIGSHSSNYQFSVTGRRAVIVSGLAALLIGAAPALGQFFFSAGQQVKG